MNKDDIFTLEDNKEYLVLETIELNQEKYLYSVSIDKEEKPTDEYKYWKVINENGEIFTEEITDKKIIEALTSLCAANYLKKETDEEQDV